MKNIKTISLSILILGVFGFSACNKAILHSRDREMEPVSKIYNVSSEEAFKTTKEILIQLGYKIDRDDPADGTLVTGWQSTKAGSHYVDLFDHKDYGTVGAYYRLKVHVTEEGGKAKVEISAPVRSIIGRLHSAHSEENKVLSRLADHVRREDFEMTNVGVTE